jgi:hypothetical protein
MSVSSGADRTIVVAAHRGDAAAMALATLLRRRGRRRTMLVDEAQLSRSTIVHRPSSGPVTNSASRLSLTGDALRLPDETLVDAASAVVLWRLARFPTGVMPVEHREYADAEAHAFAVSWLSGLGRAVVNRPDPMSLPGAHPHLLQLSTFARQVGLSAPAFQLRSSGASGMRMPGLAARAWTGQFIPFSPETGGAESSGPPLPRPDLRVEPFANPSTVLVLGDAVIGADPTLAGAGLARSLVELARVVGLDCAEITLAQARGSGRCVVTGIAPVPSLAGPGHLAALAVYLECRSAAQAEDVAA